MGDVQGGYTARMAKPSPGTVEGLDFNSRTATCETAAGIGFGLAVSQGAGDKGAVLGGTLAHFLGISIRDVTLIASDPAYLDKYERYKNMAYLNQGQIWVLAGAAVAANDPVWFNATTGALNMSTGIGPIPGARWVTSGANGDRALVELQARG